MIHQTSRLITAAFREKNINYGGVIEEIDSASVVNARMSIRNGPNIIIRFISTNEKNDVVVKTTGLVCITEDKRPQIYKALNEVNCHFRYAKFILEDEEIRAVYDFPLSLPDHDVGAIAIEVLVRFTNIVEAAYPTFMKALWG